MATAPAVIPTPANLKPHEIFRYGIIFDGRKFNDLEIELYCYKIGRPKRLGGLGKWGHFKRFVDLTWNNPQISPNVNFVWNEWASKMLKSAMRNKMSAWAGCASSGKCLGGDTEVLMYDGSRKKARLVEVGDRLMGDDSTPRTVLGLSRGRDEMFRITQDNGESWECNSRHQLTLRRRDAGPKAKHLIGTVEDVELRDYLKGSSRYKSDRRMISVGVDFPEQPVPIDPRMYGIWLGDGRKSGPQITASDREVEVLDYMRGWAGRTGYQMIEQRYGNPRAASWSFVLVPFGVNSKGKPRQKWNSSPFYDLTKLSTASGIKRIDPRYLINSRAVRLETLAGLIDSDGHASNGGGYFEIVARDTGFKDDVTYLAQSLGFRVRSKHRRIKCGEKMCGSWRIGIFGDVEVIPTLRKKGHSSSRNTTQIRFEVESLGEGDYFGFEVDGNHRFLLGNFTVTHNSEAAALYAIVEYLSDPQHTLVIVTSTTLTGARQRIWKSIDRLWNALPGLPGVMVPSIGRIKGANLDGKTFGEGTGIFLLASEKKKEKDALGKLIGIKAVDDVQNGMMVSPGRLILIADELPELPESLVHAAFTNLWSNDGFKMIALGNPNTYFDAFGIVCKPKDGWDSISVDDEEWETERGVCLRFDSTVNPRILGDERCFWMQSQEQIDQIARDYGERSVYYYRMVKGFWAPQGASDSLYTPSDIMAYGTGKVPWGLKPPIKVAALDPAFSYGGDRSILYFGTYGESAEGLATLQFDDYIALKEDLELVRKGTPRSQQIVKMFREECEKRGIRPEHTAFDSTGAGPFGDMIAAMWSNQVMRVNFAGKATNRPISPHDRTPASERYDNKMSELWAVGKSLLRAGQLKGIGNDLAKEMCQRTYETVKGGEGMRIRVESKPDYKARIGESPDICDAAFVLVDLCRERFAFKSGERAPSSAPMTGPLAATGASYTPPPTPWGQFVNRVALDIPTLI